MAWDWSQAGQGAAGGAAGGAMFGPWGAAIGGLGGGLLGGLFGGGQNEYQEQLRKLAGGYGKRTAPQAGPAMTADMSGFRQNQAGLVAQLEARARGEGPSAATMQMREAMDRAAGAQASAAAGAGGRGVNAGAAMRNAMNNTAAVQAQGARDTATLRAQEQANAFGQLGQVVAQGRAADESTNQFNAGQGNQMAMDNARLRLQQMGINDEATLRALMAAMGVEGPGLGTQLFAGGANMLPFAMQRQYAQRQQPQNPGYNQWGSASAIDFGPGIPRE